MASGEQELSGRRELGAVGVWAPWWLWEQEGAAIGEAAAELEVLGFGTLWVANGPGMLETAASLLSTTGRITEHYQAGADHVAIQLLTQQTDSPTRESRRLPRAEYRQLAGGVLNDRQ